MMAENFIAAGNKPEAIKVFRKMGDVCRESDAFIEAVQYHNRAMALAEETGNQTEIILCLNAIGTDYRRLGAYEDASDYHYKALQMCERQDDQNSEMALKNKVMSYSGIGNVYLRLNNIEEAEAAFHIALEGERQLGSHLGIAMNYSNIGNIFESRKNYDSAKIYYRLSLLEDSIAGSAVGVALGYNHLGKIAELQGDLDLALREYHRAYDIMNDQSIDRWHWMNACLSIIRANIAKGNMEIAADYLKRAEAIALKLQYDNYLALVYEMKYDYFEKKGDFRHALDNYILSRKYADNALNLNNINHVNNLRILYETAKKEFTITTLKKQRAVLGLAIGFILFLAVTTFLLLWRWMAQKKTLADQQILQMEQEKQLAAAQAALDGETAERMRLARDLHDGLGGLLSSVKLSLNDMVLSDTVLSDMTPSDKSGMTSVRKLDNMLNECIMEMRRVAHNLMPGTLMRSGLKSALEDFCNNIQIAEFNYFGDEQRFDQKLEVNIYRIAHELINNALKHSECSHILVQIVQEPNRISLTVQDNGKGFDVKTATGMGFANIRTRVFYFGGTFNIYSSPKNGKNGESGTEVNVEFQI
jgi:signal transduction histidine kinase